MSAQLDGFYAAYLSAKGGQGLALLIFREGLIVGVDVAGVSFDGRYSETADGVVSISLLVKTPPNVALIQGGTSGPEGLETQLAFQMPRDFTSQPFVRVEGPRGPINTKLVRLRGLNE
jgi:hypothetical protein